MDIWEFISHDRFAMDAGIRLVSCGDGEAVAEVALEPRHLNAVGTAQGGLIFTLADTAFAAAANAGAPETVSLSTTINFLRPARAEGGKLTAHAVTISRGRSVCCIDVTVTDEQGRAVAKLQCTGFSK